MRHGEALWVAGAKYDVRRAGQTGLLQASKGDGWQNAKTGAIAYHAIAFAHETIVSATTRRLDNGEFRHELTAVNPVTGEERPLCSMPRSLQDVSVMDDGAVVAVGLGGVSVVLSEGVQVRVGSGVSLRFVLWRVGMTARASLAL